MNSIEYARVVVQSLWKRTREKRITWTFEGSAIRSEIAPEVRVRISFRDEGPDSAQWRDILMYHPVGDGATMLDNPALGRTSLEKMPQDVAAQIDDIFEQVVLGPRRHKFAAAIRQIAEA